MKLEDRENDVGSCSNSSQNAGRENNSKIIQKVLDSFACSQWCEIKGTGFSERWNVINTCLA